MTAARRERAGWSVAKQGLAVLAAGAGLGATVEAEAGIVYTDVIPDAIAENSVLGIDLNNDGTIDFTLQHFTFTGGYQVDLTSPSAANQVMGTSALVIPPLIPPGPPLVIFPPKPFALTAGTFIPSGPFTRVDDFAGLVAGSDGKPNWEDGTNAYLGLRFDIDGSNHYGWAHLLVQANTEANRVTLFDYAYCSEPDAGLPAGATEGLCTAVAPVVPLPPSVALLAAGAVTALALRRRGDED